MYKGTPYVNKIIKKRQQQRMLQIHKHNLKGIRPVTQQIDVDNPYDPSNMILNNKKKDMLQQDRFTEIQRQNRMLLQKINVIMSKKSSFLNSNGSLQKTKRRQSIGSIVDKTRMNKSLNQGFRKKQLQGIQIQNAKLLKRLQDKKSDYQAKKLKQQWKQQKNIIKNIVNYPFIIRDKIYKSRRKSNTSQSFHLVNGYPYTPNPTSFSSPVQLVRIRNLGGHNFLLTVKYDSQNGLQIMGDNKATKQIKVIQIPRQQAMQFIQYQCDGKLQGLFQCLKYDQVTKVLYLVGKGVDIGVKQHQNQEDQQGQSKKNLNKNQYNTNSQQENTKNLIEQTAFIKSQLSNKNLSNILQQQAQQSHLKTQNNMNRKQTDVHNIMHQLQEQLVNHNNENGNKVISIEQAQTQQNKNKDNKHVNTDIHPNAQSLPQLNTKQRQLKVQNQIINKQQKSKQIKNQQNKQQQKKAQIKQ